MVPPFEIIEVETEATTQVEVFLDLLVELLVGAAGGEAGELRKVGEGGRGPRGLRRGAGGEDCSAGSRGARARRAGVPLGAAGTERSTAARISPIVLREIGSAPANGLAASRTASNS